MEYKIFDSELKVLEILWEGGELSAKDVAAQASEQVGWSKTTTYTVLKKCVEKGLVERTEPGFRCRALVSRQEAQRQETRGLIDRMYGGSADRLVASLLEGRALSGDEVARLRRLVEELR
ncbi:MAG: BlaI/MecI/CopY family transcriptional regulator [Oscillospiraceae bacterium]|jgi:BlaI family penicillinase repressor|nr:BlaI/MecI/CopY family transcriptional regulator [Oscillospiraceae bacterium]MDE6996953.1 BlaI/MecI/CopY family transcriptional regulator [Oscillospiraceae bacterium]